MNLPNSITMSRIVMIPLLLWILSQHFPGRAHPGEQEILASVLFVLASITDGVDGYLARRRGQITTMGMLLDPLADKLMVTAGYIALVRFAPNIVPVWIAVLVIGREFLVSGLRSIATAEGFTIEASEIGKLKTVIQIVSVVAAACEIAVQPVSDGGRDKDQRGDDLLRAVVRHAGMRVHRSMRREQPDEQGNACDAAHRDGVGQVHRNLLTLAFCHRRCVFVGFAREQRRY